MVAATWDSAPTRPFPGAGDRSGSPALVVRIEAAPVATPAIRTRAAKCGFSKVMDRRYLPRLWLLFALVVCWCAGCVAAKTAVAEGGAAVTGQLQVRVSSFSNLGGQVAGGGCCLHPGRPPACTALCRTFFRVCITHAPRSGPAVAGVSQGQRATLKACPMGLLVTRVVANGSLVAGDDGVLDMTFPFTEPWPVDFRLILEAWHDVTGRLFQASRRPGKGDAGGQLIARHIATHRQEGGRPWSFHAHGNAHTKLNYALKVTCAAPRHGPACTEVCRSGVEARGCNTTTTTTCEDNCSEEHCVPPEKCPCPEGWTGTLCDAPICGPGCSTEHGFCTAPGECRCEVGWWGERCDLCFPYPGCQHGTCEEPWQCLCEPGWSGDLCDIRETTEPSTAARDTTETTNTEECKCHNGGTCVEAEPPLNYTCSCPALFTGRHCDYLARPARARAVAARSRASSVVKEVQKEEEDVQEEDPKATRRRLLQKYARISFRPVKSGSGAGSEARQSTPTPYVAGDRKLLPLPVVQPRAGDVPPPATAPALRKHKFTVKQPSPTAHAAPGAQESSSKNLISSVSGHVTARPRLVQVLNSQRRPILVSLPAAALSTPPPAPDPAPDPAPSTPAPTDRPFRSFSFPTLGTSRPSTPEPRGPINLYPRKLTTPPASPTTPPPATTTTTSTTTTTTTTPTPTTRRPWPKVKVTLWPPAPPRRLVSITRHAVQGPPVGPRMGVGGLAGLLQAAAVERHEASGTERLETLRPLSGEAPPQHALRHRLGAVEALPVLEDPSPLTSREGVAAYYEQNVNGRVHIGDVSGVDAAPEREILDAFIELKKV